MAKVLARSLYETDYYAWTKQQAAELRRLAKADASRTLDLDNLAEEVESLGRSDLATVRSHLRRIIEHLLKLEHSPSAEPRLGWNRSLRRATSFPTSSPRRYDGRSRQGSRKPTSRAGAEPTWR
jgi:hypothetical protein